MPGLVIFTIFAALTFDFLNGFHDSANSIATVVSTRVLTPIKAVFWAAFFNFVAAFTFGTGVAKTVGSGFVDEHIVTVYVVLAGVIGAIVWDLLTWWFGLPTSSSHAIIGGFAGAATARAAALHGWSHAPDALVSGKWLPTISFIFVAPLIGLAAAFLLMIVVYRLFRHASRSRMETSFRHLQLVSAAALSLSHGTNDGQKTMGFITGLLVATGRLKSFHVPLWVLLCAHAAIALGTLAGGWRIVHTMGRRLTPLVPRSGFSAETGAAVSILLSTHWGLPDEVQATWAKVNFDRQIVAIAKSEGCSTIYSTDGDVKKHAAKVNLPCVHIAELPLPVPDAQLMLDLPSIENTTTTQNEPSR